MAMAIDPATGGRYRTEWYRRWAVTDAAASACSTLCNGEEPEDVEGAITAALARHGREDVEFADVARVLDAIRAAV